ncbi:MAG: hypothetical protein JJLCMIEE_00670 [Acidimicrobiales bacterium]|nr:MAG: rod shape-determining protein MreD [Actinomycetota bacterium]MBV6507620.1 hypothetical protein [Acidimicrobiales bacterium]RIK07553.1 MAG: rod shape-determining protein MreD [Acidobacteriota bacterium]
MLPPWARYGLVLFTGLVLQVAFFSELRLHGVSANVMLLLAIAAGLAGGPERGALVGFAAGLCIDLVLPAAVSPLGMSALTFCIVGFVVGKIQTTIIRSAWWIPMLVTAAASAVGVVLYALIGEVLGRNTLGVSNFGVIVGVVALFNGILSPLAIRCVTWAEHTDPRLRAV